MRFPGDLIVESIFIGKSVQRWEGRPASAIDKQSVDGEQWLTTTGLRGDEQADLTVHGGREKALHHYPSEHYAFWAGQMPELAAKFVPGGFGENLATTGLTEDVLCIGDVLQIGEATVQVTQGRQPCWKLSAHMGREDMAAQFQKSGRTGWYYRVLEEGTVRAGDLIALQDRPQPGWSLSKVIAARFNPRLDRQTATALSEIEELSASWRSGFARKSNPDYAEDTAARLVGK